MDRKSLQIFAIAMMLAAPAAKLSLRAAPPEDKKPFVCPITHPNGSQPPTTMLVGPDIHGNGSLWVSLARDGKFHLRQTAHGEWGAKVPWWREVHGQLTITGRRLDSEAPPLRAVSDGYGDTGFVASLIYLPTEGCWEVTGQAGKSTLTFVVDAVLMK